MNIEDFEIMPISMMLIVRDQEVIYYKRKSVERGKKLSRVNLDF